MSFENAYTHDATFLERLILSYDRGQYVRQEEEYLKIFREFYTDIRYDIRRDLLHIPYIHLITVMKN